MLIDTHAHLNDKIYSKEKLTEILSNMEEDNLEKIITVSYDELSCYENLNIAKNNKNVYAAVGVHPDNIVPNLNFLNEFIKEEKVIAIGEIGLDYHYTKENKENQIIGFLKQLKLAYENKLPVIIHLRDAYEDMLNLLKENKELLKYGAVVHCYSGSLEYALELIKLGVYISFTGVITFKNANKILDVVKNIPLNKVMIETDCPYLCPEPFRGKINEPKFVNFVFNKICELRNITKEELSNILRENVREFFKI